MNRHAIIAVLRDHFPQADQEKTAEATDAIVSAWHTAGALQGIERNSRNPARDIEDLWKVARHLRKACDRLTDVGWHGGAALLQLGTEAMQQSSDWPAGHVPMVARADAPDILRAHLEHLARGFEDAAASIDTEAPPVFDYLGEGSQIGRPFGTQAHFVARECRDAFEELSGESAKRRTEWDSGKCYGPFPDFVRDVFGVLSVDANVEGYVRQVAGAGSKKPMEENPTK